jgi:DNA modification methylase
MKKPAKSLDRSARNSSMPAPLRLGPYPLGRVTHGDCCDLAKALPPESIDLVITSPPYWGQRTSRGTGIEADPRVYLDSLRKLFSVILPALKPGGLLWLNLGDAYNTPVNWRPADRDYSTLGAHKAGLGPHNSAYTKPRARRRAVLDPSVPWLTYGNLLALPYRLVIGLCDDGYLFRGEIIWKKTNPMPGGGCRRPHRSHEGLYLLAKDDRHPFRTTPPVKSVWEFGSERLAGLAHFSRFPLELPLRCIQAYGKSGPEVVVLDPFAGSGTTGLAATELGCLYLGFEIDSAQVKAANLRLACRTVPEMG